MLFRKRGVTDNLHRNWNHDVQGQTDELMDPEADFVPAFAVLWNCIERYMEEVGAEDGLDDSQIEQRVVSV